MSISTECLPNENWEIILTSMTWSTLQSPGNSFFTPCGAGAGKYGERFPKCFDTSNASLVSSGEEVTRVTSESRLNSALEKRILASF